MTLDLKRTAIFGASFGSAVVLTLGALYWLLTRPKGWDSHSIKGTSLTVFQTLHEEAGNLVPSGWDLQLVLENDNRSDYTVPADFKLFARDDKSSALHELKAVIDHPYVIPAKEKAEVHVQYEYSCADMELSGKTAQRPSRQCFNDAFAHISGFVGFDYAALTRIDLPKPVYAGEPDDAPAKAGSAWLTPPDKETNWFKKVDACDVADHLVVSCKAQHFLPLNVPGDPFADSGYSNPLPMLPMLIKGYTVDPNKSDCRTANEWKVYCESNKLSK